MVRWGVVVLRVTSKVVVGHRDRRYGDVGPVEGRGPHRWECGRNGEYGVGIQHIRVVCKESGKMPVAYNTHVFFDASGE